MTIQIEPARFPEDKDVVVSLFSGYAASLGIDLTFQQFQAELDSLPGKYAEPKGGALLIAREHRNLSVAPGTASQQPIPSVAPAPLLSVGCVALRRSADNWCEMKRLYVVREARGMRLGEILVEAILVHAKSMGYRGIRLDTLPEMAAAQRLYRKYGFVEINPYYDTPIKGTIFMGFEFSPQ
ncbi:hypothetical protein NUU61_005803 [Penicillium alfredii]|uniref:N-acetyltransferase domain-containing protein n=1 Tax=Penicillium alfredii TaxID=1506179 RepID=A0A9W9FA39_9EURO|nr:uncharacterized protein NUU61_005803 [Penicillium alfredii]KAJ5096447.1 hypothetical protein NUU61_005803 [Penicillium alfredii]